MITVENVRKIIEGLNRIADSLERLVELQSPKLGNTKVVSWGTASYEPRDRQAEELRKLQE